MIGYEMPEFIKKLQKSIPNEELYIEDGKDEYGCERECHVTLVPCLDKHFNVEDLKSYLDDLNSYSIILSNISKFDNDKFDVLKCDVGSMKLHDTNRKICNKFKTFSEYDEYHPHMTIAYLKKGIADKYLKDSIMPIIKLKPRCFMWSSVDENDEDVNLEWN